MKAQTNRAILSNKLPQSLRRDLTDAERLLWQSLRGRQMYGFKFRRQHPYGDYILDLVSFDAKLVIEVDGGQHAEDRHRAKDALRTAYLERAGFRVLRFWNTQVVKELEAVKSAIFMAVAEKCLPHPHPNPPLEGEGE